MSKQISEAFKKSSTRIKSIAFHPINPTFITAHHCGAIRIWNILYQQNICVLREHIGSVRAVKIHPSGNVFATAGDDKLVRIWNYKTKKVMHALKGHTDYIRSIDFHPTRPWIISGSDDCLIKIWDFMSGQLICSSTGHTHYVMSVLFADSTHIITGSLDHTIGLWDCSNLFEKKKLMVPGVVLMQTVDAHERGINSLYLHEGNLISGSDDKEVKVWSFRSDNIILEKSYFNHEATVTSVYYDGQRYYSGSEDSSFAIIHKGKSNKISVMSRVWCISGKNEYLALGTDDGLIVYRNQSNRVYACNENNVFHTQDNVVYRYNFKQSSDYGKLKENIENMFLLEEKLVVQTKKQYFIFEDGKKSDSEAGCIAYQGKDKFVFLDNNLYKNDDLYRPNILSTENSANQVRLFGQEKRIFITSNNTLVCIENDEEISSTFNFRINNVLSREDEIVVFGSNKILILDRQLKIVHSVSELVEITGGIFYNDILIYCTLKQIKYFYEDQGILQSIDGYYMPVVVKNEFIYLLGAKGIEKFMLNQSEIRFRKAVLDNENILSVIESEQLPGLSPLEYLIQKGKGGIALPYIKDEEKRFELYLSENSLKDALKLCKNNKMYEDLAFKALSAGNYEIAELCFKKTRDSLNLFFLFLSTKNFEKMKELEGEEIENMVKIVLEDKSILSLGAEHENVRDQEVDLEVAEDNSNKSANKKNANDKPAKIADDEIPSRRNEDPLDDVCADLNKMNIDSSKEDDTTSNSSLAKTDMATINDSDYHCQICCLSEASLKCDERDPQSVYEEALEYTTVGKFSKALDAFRISLCNVASKLSESDDFLSLRKSIGNYLLGLNIEKARRSTQDAERNIELSLFFADLPLEADHKILAKNLAMTTCFKHKNFKTAKRLAEMCPEGKNAAKILASEENDDAYEIKYTLKEGEYVEIDGTNSGYLCFDTLGVEKDFRSCALCFVKSKTGEKCGACEIGILH